MDRKTDACATGAPRRRAALAGARAPHRPLRVLLVVLGAVALGLACRSPAHADEPRDRHDAILSAARSALVAVDLFVKLPADDDADAISGAGEVMTSFLEDRQLEQLARDKKAIQLMGVAVAPRALVVPDTGVDPQRIERWEVTEAGGRRTVAQRSGVLLDVPALVLEPIEADASWTVPDFTDAAIEANTPLVAVTPQWSAGEWVLAAAPLRSVTAWEAGSGDAAAGESFWLVAAAAERGAAEDALFGRGPRPAAAALILDAQGRPLGAAFASRVYARRTVPPWRAADLRTAPRMDPDDQVRDRVRDRLSGSVYPVRIEYRRPRGGSQTFPDSELLGWAISERWLLVPHGIHRTVAARIARISVRLAGRDAEARFLGHFKDFDAFLVALADDADPLPAHADLRDAAALRPYRPHAAVTLRNRYGETELHVETPRVLGSERGFENRRQPELRPAPPLGSLLLDLDGKSIGIFARRRRPLEELEPYERISSSRGRFSAASGGTNAELFTLAEWSSVLGDPGGQFDPHVVWREEKDQERRVWLGVEFNPLTRELAESLGCRKEARDGAVGLMISQMYAGSPAEAAGLRAGDVLLRVDLPGRPRAIELSPHEFLQQSARGPGGRGMGDGARAPWPSRNNYLTNLLAIVGAGTPLRVSVWRDGKLEVIETRVEDAPPDQDSAAQFKDAKLGITVREATYEVRAALNMTPTDPGVVVTKVESGSPAALAKVTPYEIVQSAGGEPLDAPAKLEELIQKARDDKADTLRLVLVNRGRSRFADLTITP